jgi:hypothetical protein
VTYRWDEAELAQVEASANRAMHGPAPIGHNSIPADIPTITGSASAAAMAAAAPELAIVSLDGLRRAIRDDELDRSHLKVLANLSERFNGETYTAWPSREVIAEEEGLDPKSVNNNLYDLRRLRYIDWGRLPDPKRPRRTFQHYWWLQDQITTAVTAIREKAAAESAPHRGQKGNAETPPYGGQKKSPPRRANAETAPYRGLETAPYRGNKESLNKEEEKGDGAVTPTLPFVGDGDATVAANALPRQPSSTSTPKSTPKRRLTKTKAADPEQDPEVIAREGRRAEAWPSDGLAAAKARGGKRRSSRLHCGIAASAYR